MKDVELKKCSRIRVVAVDGRPIWLAGLRSVLRSTRFKIVDEAMSCADAVPVVAQTNPHLLLLGPRAEMDTSHVQAIRESLPRVVIVALVDRNTPAFGDRTTASNVIEYLPASIGCGELIVALIDIVARNGLPIVPVPLDVADRNSHCSELPVSE